MKSIIVLCACMIGCSFGSGDPTPVKPSSEVNVLNWNCVPKDSAPQMSSVGTVKMICTVIYETTTSSALPSKEDWPGRK
jgi:hypothetical protein